MYTGKPEYTGFLTYSTEGVFSHDKGKEKEIGHRRGKRRTDHRYHGGGLSAYFTASSSATNTFTVGNGDSNVSVNLEEPNWDPEDAKDITPLQEFAKNPIVTNTGDNDVYVFQTVTIPYENIETAAGDGKKIAAADTQLFSYGYDGTAGVKTDWTLVKTGKVGDLTIADTTSIAGATESFGAIDTANKTITYVFAYTGGSGNNMKALPSGSTTSSPFDFVKFVNATEATTFDGKQLDVICGSYAIQTANLNESGSFDGSNGNTTTDCAKVWTILQNSVS